MWEAKRLENNPGLSVDEMREQLEKHQEYSPLVNACFRTARMTDLSEEQTYVILAYHAVRMYEEMFDREVERVQCQLPAPIVVWR